MKRYLLFTGSRYYPSGGWDDLQGNFDTIEEARAGAANETGRWRWWQIIDIQDPDLERAYVEAGEINE